MHILPVVNIDKFLNEFPASASYLVSVTVFYLYFPLDIIFLLSLI